MDKEGMQFWTFYGQPSCRPGRAAMITGRIPNRSGMTTVAFQGQGGGLPAAEGTTASVLQKAGYNTYFTGKWHLGESDYAMPTADGFDKMDNVILYHLNAFTYSMPSFHPKMTPDQLDFFKKSSFLVLVFSGLTLRNYRRKIKFWIPKICHPTSGVVTEPHFLFARHYRENVSL